MKLDNLAKGALLLGFLAISLAIVIGYTEPATGYELSIYTGTPTAFWTLVTFGLLISVVTVFSVSSWNLLAVGGFLGIATMTTIVSLPIIRGYHYVGEHDPLSHFGTTKNLDAGVISMMDTPYPVVHTLGSVYHTVTGFSVRHALLLLISLFVVLFFVFVPIVVRQLTANNWMAYLALFSGLLLLPINHLGSHHYIFPTSQAIMFSPVVLFVFFLLYRQRTLRRSVIFLLVAVMFVLLHPQQAANLIIFTGVIAAGQISYDLSRGFEFRPREWVLPEVGIFAAIFFLWVQNLNRFWRTVDRVASIPFQSTTPGGKAATRTDSLNQVGGSVLEVFLKLFSVRLFYILLTGLLVGLIILGLYKQKPEIGGQMPPLYIVAGLTGVAAIFLVFLIGGISDQSFRHLGLLMVFGTILGAIALGQMRQQLSRRWSPAVSNVVITVVFVLCILISLLIVFPSPYIYYYSHHVTEQQMNGYETTFEYQGEDIYFDDIRANTYRYGHAIEGSNRPPESYYPEDDDNIHSGVFGIPNHFANRSLRTYYENQRYIPVPESDRIRDPELWNGFRFSHEDFEYLDTEPGINKVQSNGGYDLYLVSPVTPIDRGLNGTA